MSCDVWYYLSKDKTKVIQHWENDGLAYLKRGPEATETEMTVVDFLNSHFMPSNSEHKEILEELLKNSIIAKCDCHKGYRILSTEKSS